MANLKAAKKSIRADARKRIFNDRRRKAMKGAVKTVTKLISLKKKEEALQELPRAFKAIDKAAKAGVIKKNTADRKKSRLAKTIDEIK